MREVTYGEGGYNPSAPDDNIVADETIVSPAEQANPGLVQAKATLAQALDPTKPNPTTSARLDAIEQLLAASPGLLP